MAWLGNQPPGIHGAPLNRWNLKSSHENHRDSKSAFNQDRLQLYPLIIGICTSEIKHAVSATRCDWRNSCADAKVYTSKPSDFTRFSVAARNRGKFPGGGQGNCISKEREEFDEIILIPGGFLNFPRKDVLLSSLRMTLSAMWRSTARLCGPLSMRFSSGVFVHDHVETPMQTIFHAPMAAHDFTAAHCRKRRC